MNNDILLFKAIEKLDYDAVLFLLDNGCDINCEDEEGNTLLHKLLNNQDDDVVYIIDHIYNPNSVLFDIYLLLLERGIKLYHTNNKGETIYHRIHSLEIAEKYLERGGCPNYVYINKSEDIKMPISFSFTVPIYKYFMKKSYVDINIRDEEGLSRLYYSDENSRLYCKYDPDVIKFLVEQGADPTIGPGLASSQYPEGSEERKMLEDYEKKFISSRNTNKTKEKINKINKLLDDIRELLNSIDSDN